MMKNRVLLSLIVPLLSATLLTGCGSDLFKDKKQPLPGKRLSVLQLQQTLEPARDTAAAPFEAPQAWANDQWPQAGGYANHSLQHVALNTGELHLAWKADIGSGANARLPLTAQPVIAEGKVFTVDREQNLAAFDAASGKNLWRVNIKSPHEKDAVIGGGISYANGNLYATNGYNDIVALSAKDGHLVWQATLPSPSRAAPTSTDDRVFVTTLDNHVLAFGAAKGEQLWDYAGLTETAGLIGAASPAATGDIVVPGFSSGEIDALLVENGTVSWSENLGEQRNAGGLASIPDIRGLPVIDKDMVFAVSFGGKMIAVDQRTGNRVWQKDVGSDVTPWVAGNLVFVLTLENDLIALARDTGGLRWVAPLQRYKKDKDPTSEAIYWTAPVLAGGRLILASSNGKVAEVSPGDGKVIREWKTDRSVSLPLVAAGGTLYLLADDGTLMAYK